VADSPLVPLLDALRDEFRTRGLEVDRHLRPGLSRDAVVERTRELGLSVPDEIVELYGWHDGQSDEAEFAPDAFQFRDNAFISLERAIVERGQILEFYGGYDTDEYVPLGFDLEQCFPFATYMGSWHVVVCGPHTLASAHPHPVVNVYQGIVVFFHSIELMLRTCIDWVRHPRWSPESHLGLADDVELEIWRRHNPGLPAEAAAVSDY
jgi:hypothetical protein